LSTFLSENEADKCYKLFISHSLIPGALEYKKLALYKTNTNGAISVVPFFFCYFWKMTNAFTKKLLSWFEKNHRPMPWKGEKNPYLIWLSEIILQQTRVAQGLPYFEKFKAAYPTITDLANAPEDDVLKLWEGLGYYSRARNLHFTARDIRDNYEGVFPTAYEDILKLKGVGIYTAAAIASFAYDLPYAVLDGNVFRVLSRYFGIKEPIDTTTGKKLFIKLSQELLAKKKAADYNQAIMDFGATQCVPANPDCKVCPFNKACVARQKNLVSQLPIKSKKLKKRSRFFHFLIVNDGDQVWIRKRVEKDIWQGLYEFPLLEKEKLFGRQSLERKEEFQKRIPAEGIISRVSAPFTQQLTHQKINAVFFEINLERPLKKPPADWIKIYRKDLGNYAFPRIIDLYLQDKSLYLNF